MAAKKASTAAHFKAVRSSVNNAARRVQSAKSSAATRSIARNNADRRK
jgi:hypothetical protein